jgi:hypothetical protein
MKLRSGKIIHKYSQNTIDNTIKNILNTYVHINMDNIYNDIESSYEIVDSNINEIPTRIEIIGTGTNEIDGVYNLSQFKYCDMPQYKHNISEACLYYLCGWTISCNTRGFYETEFEDTNKLLYSQRTQLPPINTNKWKHMSWSENKHNLPTIIYHYK